MRDQRIEKSHRNDRSLTGKKSHVLAYTRANFMPLAGTLAHPILLANLGWISTMATR